MFTLKEIRKSNKTSRIKDGTKYGLYYIQCNNGNEWISHHGSFDFIYGIWVGLNDTCLDFDGMVFAEVDQDDHPILIIRHIKLNQDQANRVDSYMYGKYIPQYRIIKDITNIDSNVTHEIPLNR